MPGPTSGAGFFGAGDGLAYLLPKFIQDMPMLRKFRTTTLSRKLRGVTLLETLLALSIGGIVIASSVVGLKNYSEGVKVQATASMLDRLTAAADRYADDNFEQLVANAPQELNISVLEPYYGSNIRTDAFRTQYRLSTRTYTYRVAEPGGGTRDEQALQVLVVGRIDPNGPLQNDQAVRADVANSAGNGAGFIATASLTCQDSTGATRAAGDICGAFGSYSFDDREFRATNFRDIGYVSLITKGDSSVYGDQLYRYDFGDPELNTMRTDLHMDNRDITDPERITGVNNIQFSGSQQSITTPSGGLALRPSGTLLLQPGSDRTVLAARGSRPVLASSTPQMQIGDSLERVYFGQETIRELTGGGAGRRLHSGADGSIRFGDAAGSKVNASEINSLFENPRDPLRLQNFANGEVIVGKRVRYQNGTSGTYEIADGTVRAQNVQVQDITCADCGGSLANILPRWRHMGTYYIEDLAVNPRGTFVPYPECSNGNRRELVNRSQTNEEASFSEPSYDGRYRQKIVVMPKEMGLHLGANVGVLFSFYAQRSSSPAGWRVFPRVQNSTQAREGGKATALAATYCVFEGGNAAPESPSFNNLNNRNGGGWVRLD